MDISVVVPTHPARLTNGMTTRALASVAAQTLIPTAVHIPVDTRGEGAAATRTRGLAAVDTEWVAFLDSDDEMLPRHLELLAAHQQTTGADLIYPWFEPQGMSDPLGWFGKPFDPDHLKTTANYIPITVLARTDALRKVGAFVDMYPGSHGATCEDWRAWISLVDAGYRIVHLPERTWRWNAHPGNTSGRAGYGDAQ